MKPIKNAIIVSGEIFSVHHINYIPGSSPAPCNKCAIHKRCQKDLQPCRVFNKGSRLAYFKKEEKICTVNRKVNHQ